MQLSDVSYYQKAFGTCNLSFIVCHFIAKNQFHVDTFKNYF